MKLEKVDGAVVAIMTVEEAEHIGHRLNTSSSKSFNDYREINGLDGKFPRHPFADEYEAAFAAAIEGVN